MLAAVTGAEGFIGSHLVEALVKGGTRVRAMVLNNSFSSWGWLETLPAEVMDEVEVVPSDVRDAAAVLEFLRGADVVYHLAALIAIPYSYRAPSSYLDTNARHTQRAPGRAPARGAPRRAHLDQRGVRNGAPGADRREPPAPGAVAVRGLEDRGRQAGGELPPSRSAEARGVTNRSEPHTETTSGWNPESRACQPYRVR